MEVMSESVLMHIRSLCYGINVAVYAAFVVRMVDSMHRQSSPHARFAYRCSVVTLIALVLINCTWFVFDYLDKNTDVWLTEHQTLHWSLHIAEMFVVPVMGAALLCISRLKKFSPKAMLLWMLPFELLFVLYLATSCDALFYIAFGCMTVYCIGIFIAVVYYVRHYQTLLNNTYANTSQRGVNWLLRLLHCFALLFFFWLTMDFIVGTIMADIVYGLFGILPWAYFVNRMRKQNFDIRIMREIVESGEDESDNDEDGSTGEDSNDSAPVPNVVQHLDLTPHSALKKWQEPEFDEAVRSFCNDRSNFTNSELSVQDVANGVGSNRTYVSRWCKEQGTDFSSYITDIRLVYAEQLLVTTDKTIVEIVDLSGFSNPRYFRTVFAAKYGCPPSEYRAARASVNDK